MERLWRGMGLLLMAGLILLGGSGKAQAVVGIPDDVPAATLLYPFFTVDPTPATDSRLDSLIVVTNTSNRDILAHITIWSVRSEHIYNFTVSLTEHDVYSCSLLDLLVNPETLAEPCEAFQAPTGVVGDLTVGDILAGYVTVDVVNAATSLFPGQAGYPFLDWNILVGHLYLVNLPAGSAAGFNAVSIEAVSNFPFGSTAVGQAANAVLGFESTQTGFYLTRCIESQGGGAASVCAPLGTYGNRERIDGPAGDVAQTGSAVQPAGAEDSPLSLIVRYFSVPALNGRTQVWLWKDRNTSGAAAEVNLAVYDEDENAHSVTLNLPNEVNFGSTEETITPGAPGGWFRIKFDCGPFGSCGYNPLDGSTWEDIDTTPIQAVAYALQFANDQAANLRWDAVFPAHRQYTNYQGGAGAE
jgi:hypothetical protein